MSLSTKLAAPTPLRQFTFTALSPTELLFYFETHITNLYRGKETTPKQGMKSCV